MKYAHGIIKIPYGSKRSGIAAHIIIEKSKTLKKSLSKFILKNYIEIINNSLETKCHPVEIESALHECSEEALARRGRVCWQKLTKVAIAVLVATPTGLLGFKSNSLMLERRRGRMGHPRIYEGPARIRRAIFFPTAPERKS
jgi:hypothetical protein